MAYFLTMYGIMILVVSIPSKISFNRYRSAYGIDRQKVIDKQIVDKRGFFFFFFFLQFSTYIV